MALFVFLSFLLIRIDVIAMSNQTSVRIDVVGSSDFSIYHGTSTPTTYSPTYTTQMMNGLRWAILASPNATTTAYSGLRFHWTIPRSYLLNRDSFSFTIGHSPGYVNQAQFMISGLGWASCTNVSSVPQDSYINVAPAFSTFVCSYDGANLPNTDDLNIYVSALTVDYYSTNPGTASTSSTYYFNVDTYFWKSDIGDVITSVGDGNKDVTDSIDGLNDTQKETNEKLDDIANADIGSDKKELPDDSSYQDYQDKENQIVDSIGNADMSDVSIGIDTSASSFIWDTMTSSIQSHPAVFTMFVSILSIFIIKLAFGR